MPEQDVDRRLRDTLREKSEMVRDARLICIIRPTPSTRNRECRFRKRRSEFLRRPWRGGAVCVQTRRLQTRRFT